MSTETSTPIVADAPAEAPVESPAPKEIDEQPSTQLDSETAVLSEAPAAAESMIETMSQVQEEEGKIESTESSKANNSEDQKGIVDLARTNINFLIKN